MKDIQYAAPVDLEQATSLLAQHGDQARILAGGTDILVQLSDGHRSADIIVDVKKIPELLELDYNAASGLRLGASVPCYRIYENEEVVAAYTALTDSARIIGGWQIQSRASVGGNLCNSSPAADSIPPLIALQAVAHIAGPAGRRSVPADEFCTAPGRNVLQSGELLVAITIAPPAANSGSAYLRFIPRNEMDIAVVGAASWLQLDAGGENIEQARVALGAVAPTPVFAQQASEFLAGKPATDETFVAAGELAKEVATPISDMRGTAEYRTHLVGVLTKRTLAIAARRARSEAN